jgi:hypothetical protein
MKTIIGLLMAANAALFFFGAVQHAGFVLGPFQEPHIVPAAIVETLCGIALTWGAVALFGGWKKRWGIALGANLFAASGVVLGMVALAAGRGPRTASNDLYHRIMLLLVAGSVVGLFLARAGLARADRERPASRAVRDAG